MTKARRQVAFFALVRTFHLPVRIPFGALANAQSAVPTKPDPMIIRPGDCLGASSMVLRQIQIHWFSPGDRPLDPGVTLRFEGGRESER